MNIFKLSKCSGEVVKKFVGDRCDYSGRLIDPAYSVPYCSYECNYGSIDPCFGSGGEEFDFCKKYGIPAYEFLSQPYKFYDDSYMSGEFGSEEINMLKELSSLSIGETSETENFSTLESAFRFFRIRTAKRLIEQGVIQSDELY
jgi:hypothetical protein